MSWKLIEELSNRSRGFFEFVMPAIDAVEDGNDLLATVELARFVKENIHLRIVENYSQLRQKGKNKNTMEPNITNKGLFK